MFHIVYLSCLCLRKEGGDILLSSYVAWAARRVACGDKSCLSSLPSLLLNVGWHLPTHATKRTSTCWLFSPPAFILLSQSATSLHGRVEGREKIYLLSASFLP